MFWVFLATITTCLALWSTASGKVPVGGEHKWLSRADGPGRYAARLAVLWVLAAGLWAYAAWTLKTK